VFCCILISALCWLKSRINSIIKTTAKVAEELNQSNENNDTKKALNTKKQN
jgi:uncharacterized membrane protein YciS (DUF1049 family)